jgi:NADPH2:quinone reductase
MNPSIPSTMRAVQLDEPNGKLTTRELPVPDPRSGQVLIRVAAAPINPSDLGSLAGLSYGRERTFPFTPGIEGSGTVVEAGKGWIPRLLKGRRVACSAPPAGDGTWAEFMVTSAKSCAPLNKNVSLEEGATLIVNPMSAFSFIEIIQRDKHQSVANTAAASSLGGMLLRLGKRYEIPIIHIVRRPEQVDLVCKRGGEVVLNSSEADFVEQLRAAARQYHTTLFLDAVGGDMTQKLAEAAPYGSTILLYARLSDKYSAIDSRTVLLKNLHLEGWFLSNWMREKNLLQTLRFSGQVQSLLGTDLASTIHKRFPLAEAQQGLELYMGNMSAGKILLVANPQEVALNN